MPATAPPPPLDRSLRAALLATTNPDDRHPLARVVLEGDYSGRRWTYAQSRRRVLVVMGTGIGGESDTTRPVKEPSYLRVVLSQWWAHAEGPYAFRAVIPSALLASSISAALKRRDLPDARRSLAFVPSTIDAPVSLLRASLLAPLLKIAPAEPLIVVETKADFDSPVVFSPPDSEAWRFWCHPYYLGTHVEPDDTPAILLDPD